MAQLCTKCSCANPAEAVYCYYDGFVLGGHERSGGPVAVGAKPFSSPFVFPTGRNCRNFDELALACQEEWKTACALLKDGYIESFLKGLGRVDLALAAKEASRFPDGERGLDQLLAKLPSSVLNDPKLRIEPLDVNLGVLEDDGSGKDRTFNLDLENQGMRLLYGTATSDAVWLTLGDAGASEKHFNFTHEAKIKVHVRPALVRAGSKPIEAKILVESNGGVQTVVVRGQKPIKPFPDGALKGVKTPRQVAEKAQANPKQVAPLFETGEVARWYAANGWTYPVKVPAASGPAAIQQFFEAPGVTRPPKVDISHREITLQGKPGAKVPVSFEVSTQEKRPVFAHVTSNVPWLEVSKAKFNGRIAVVNMSVPTVPNRPGETLKGELSVISNGNQRFLVPVRLVIGGTAVGGAAVGGAAFDFNAPVPPPPPPPPFAAESSSLAFTDEAPRPSRQAPPPPLVTSRRRQRGAPVWMHLLPALLLLLAVLAVVVYDQFNRSSSAGEGGGTVASAGGLTGPGANYDPKTLRDARPRIGVQFDNDWDRFGVVMLDQDDPNNRGRAKKLTFADNGKTNNTIVKIGSSEYYFGFETGQNGFLRDRLKDLPAPYKGTGWSSTMNFRDEKILVMQYLQIVPSGTGLLDTLLIYYRVENAGTIPQKVALRVMLDTFIGANDGVPFTVPGEAGFVTTKKVLTGSKIPDYIEAVENPDDPKNPGTIARLGLRGLDWSDKIHLLAPERVVISRFPGDRARWDWPLEDMKDPDGNGDSSIAIYWPEKTIKSKERVHMAFTYGLGSLTISENLALSAPATAAPNREFTVTAYVYNARNGQTVELEPPAGVQVIGSRKVTITEDAKRTQVFWKVKASKEGPARFGATAGKSKAAPITVKIQGKSIFG